MPKLFGFEFDWNRRSSAPATPPNSKPTGTALSPVPPDNQDGALNVQYGTGGGYYGYYLDLDGTIVDDFQLINRYREMPLVAEVDEAIDQIINEMVVQDSGRIPVSLSMDMIDDEILDEQLKARVQAEFDGLLKQLHFQKDAYSIVRQWYIDGRLYYHLIVDEVEPDKGIQELRIIDPRTIRKIREIERKRHEETQMDILEVRGEYYVYNPMGFVTPTNITGSTVPTSSMLQYNGTRMTLDAVVFLPSGLYDSTKKTVLSWLHKAIKPLNLFRMMEDSCVIYRVARAPERRVFYIDVGNLPKNKAEQYLYEIMQKYRNKLVYDVQTGDMRDDRKFMSIMEDFWLPRREGGKGTEITTLPAGQNLSEMEDVDYFRRKLYRSLNLPPSRIDPGQGFNLGRASEISRDELRFYKFIHRLQSQFNGLFDQLLERQLRLKGVLTEREWEQIKDNIRYEWQHDSYFEELKGQEIWSSRLNLLTQWEPYINKFVSNKWLQQNVLKFTDDEMAQIKDDFDDPLTGMTDENGDPLSGEDEDDEDSPFGDDEDGDDEFEDGLDLDKQDGDEGEDFDKEADSILSDDGDDDEDEEDDDSSPFGGKKKKKTDKKDSKGKPKGKDPKKKADTTKKKSDTKDDDSGPATNIKIDKSDEKTDTDGVVWVKKSAITGDDDEDDTKDKKKNAFEPERKNSVEKKSPELLRNSL
jgi:hypothetical protein